MKKRTRTADLVLCAVFAALSAALSPFSIPIGPVPITLTQISIFLAAGLLGAKYGALSQVVFVALGAAGAPVFSGFSGGVGKLAGPTGGFIIGYIGCAFIAGLLIARFGQKMRILIPAMAAGMGFTYLLGSLWYMYVMQTGLLPTLLACVIPFLPGDAVKIILCSFLVRKLAPILRGELEKRA